MILSRILPNTIIRVILIVLIFAFGMIPREDARLLSVSLFVPPEEWQLFWLFVETPPKKAYER